MFTQLSKGDTGQGPGGHLGRDPFNQKFRFEFPKFSRVERNGIFHLTEPVTSKWRVCRATCLLLDYHFKQTDNFNPTEQQQDNNYLLVASWLQTIFSSTDSRYLPVQYVKLHPTGTIKRNFSSKKCTKHIVRGADIEICHGKF